MHNIIHDLKQQDAYYLLWTKETLEQKLINGIIEPEEIDAYVAVQLELATRSPLELMLDPRD